MFTKQLTSLENSLQPEIKESYKSFKLGEYHFLDPEPIENGIRKYYPGRASKELVIFHVFSEAYKKTDVSFLDQMLIDISEALQNYNIDDVTSLNVGDFGIYVQAGDYVQSAVYNPMTKKINVFINRKCLEHIKSYQNIPNILKRFKAVYVHEDTHKQQDAASDGRFYNANNYKKVDIHDFKTVKACVNQRDRKSVV